MALRAGSILREQIVLDRELGRGAMGAVWLATHRALGIEVAVKVLSIQGEVSAPARARFEQEARALARIDSVHVVRVYDVGTSEGEPYIVMERLRGQDLKSRLEEVGALRLDETTAIIAQVAEALEGAHTAGIVHRDLKPANIFLADGPRTLVKVLDFGVAKLEASATLGLTGTEAIVGTPYYMSPEQFVSPRDVDHRTDLWSLAVVAYACLTGRLPFVGDTVAALALAVHSGEVTPPSALVAGLPPALDGWFVRALSPEPEQRFASARSLAEAFAAAAAGAGPTTSLDASSPAATMEPPRAKPPSKRRARWISIAAVLVVAGAVGASAYVVGAVRSRGPRGGASGSASASASAPGCEVGALASAPAPSSAIAACERACGEGSTPACNAVGTALIAVSPPELSRGLLAFEGGCSAGDGAACARAGQMIARGSGTTASRTEAVKRYQRGCDLGSQEACVRLARAYATGRGVPKDRAKGTSMLRASCDGGGLLACVTLGELMLTSVGEGDQSASAVALFRRACDGGVREGCHWLAGLMGIGRGAPRDVAGAIALAKGACSGGDINGCAVLERLAPSEHTPELDARMKARLEQACAVRDPEACRFLGWKYHVGSGVPRDIARAQSLYRIACEADDDQACFNLAVIQYEGSDPASGCDMFRRLCAEGTFGCLELGRAYEEGRGVTKDPSMSPSLFSRACDAGLTEGCLELGRLHETGVAVPENLTRAAELYQKACRAGDCRGCDALAGLMIAGRGVARDPVQGSRLLTAACDDECFPACVHLAEQLRSGTGVPRDPKRADELLRRTCERGHAPACEARRR